MSISSQNSVPVKKESREPLKIPGWGTLSLPELLIALGGTTATAAGSLLLEWWLLPDSEHGVWPWIVAIFIAVVALVVTVVALNWRRTILAEKGTLYYVRLLHLGMKDFHRDQIKDLRDNHLDMRTVTRWIIEDAKTPVPGCFDFTSDVWRMAEMLQLAMNEDNIESSFSIAPNMLWPMAMGLGSHHYVMPETILIEPASAGFSKVSVHIDVDSSVVNSSERAQESARNSSPLALHEFNAPALAGTTLLSLDVTGYADAPEGYHKCGYSVRLAAANESLAAYGQTDIGQADAKRFPNIGDLQAAGVPPLPISVLTSKDAGGNRHCVDAAVLVDFCVSSIQKTLRKHPHTVVLLTMRVPKIIAMWIGMRLAIPSHQESCNPHICREDACLRPWRWLATLNYDVAAESFHYYRVHDDQPSLETVSTILNREPIQNGRQR